MAIALLQPPEGMRGEVHDRFVRLVPYERIVQAVEFDSGQPELADE